MFVYFLRQDKLLLSSLQGGSGGGGRHGVPGSPDLRSDEEGQTDEEDIGVDDMSGGGKQEDGGKGEAAGGKIRKKKTRTVFSRSQVSVKTTLAVRPLFLNLTTRWQ